MTESSNFSILFVCTGNTCRSPMAEGIAKKIAAEHNVDNFQIGSAGTSAINGLPATDYAIAAAKHWDVDISEHHSRALNKKLVKASDIILAMGSEHVEAVLALDRSAAQRVYMLKGFPKPYNAMQERIEDPIGGSLEQYNQTFLEMDEVIRKNFPHIIELSQKNE
jgi:protein-tyrosine-phosphatase